MHKINMVSVQPLDPNDSTLLQEVVGLKARIKEEDFSIANIVMKPGVHAERHIHRSSKEVYIVTSGTASMIVDGRTYPISSGDVILILPEEQHEVYTSESEELEFLAFTLPAYTPDDFIKV